MENFDNTNNLLIKISITAKVLVAIGNFDNRNNFL